MHTDRIRGDKRGIAGTEIEADLKPNGEFSDGGCFLIENTGFADVSLQESELGQDDSFVCVNNNNPAMKIEFRTKDKTAASKASPTKQREFSFVRSLLGTLAKRSTSSTISSVDSDTDGYCAFPVDDDLFEVPSSNRVSMLSDTSSENDEKVILQKQLPALTNQCISEEVKLDQGGSMPKRQSPKLRPPKERDLDSDKRRSYYVAGDDLSPDFEPEEHLPSGDDISDGSDKPCPTTGYSLPDMHPCEVWGELGPEGGVIQIPGAGISLHMLPTTKTIETHIPKVKRGTLPTGRLSRPTSVIQNIDRRVVLGLEDPPEGINNNTRVAVGSMVCADYGDSKMASAGVVLQVDVNATLKEPNEGAPVQCVYGCLIATTPSGPFEEVTGDCYHFGNTLQVAISAKDIEKVSQENLCPGGSLRLVPIVKVVESTKESLQASVWDGLSSMVVWAAVYGPKRSHAYSTCCVSVSTATTCPPTISIKRNNKGLLLHLWTAYRVGIHKPQDIQVVLQPDGFSSATTLPTSCVISAEEITQKSRINKLFTVKYIKDGRISPQEDVGSTEVNDTASRSRQNESFSLILNGLLTGTLMDMRFIAPVRTPSWSTPIKRWKKNVCQLPHARTASDSREKRAQDYLYLWHDAQREAISKLRPPFEIPGSERQINITQLAVAVTSRVRGKRQKQATPLLAEYEQSDIMPVLSKQKLWCYGTSKYKEWYVGYSRGRIGLVHVQCVRIFNTDRCYTKGNGNITVGQLIENMIEPVGDLCFCFNTLRERLIQGVNDWVLFSSILRFGENYITRVVKEIQDDSKRDIEDKYSLFLEKYKEYCMSGSRKRPIHKDIVRALLYMEEHDLVKRLVTDLCVLSLAVKIGKRWTELKTVFENFNKNSSDSIKGKSLKRSPRKISQDRDNEEVDWKPAFEWLCSVRKSYHDTDQAFLVRLHSALDALPDSPTRTWASFTGALVLILCIDSLSKHEARL